MRVAIVHDRLYVIGGAEQVLSELLRCYPDADVFTLFGFLMTPIGLAWASSTRRNVFATRAAHRGFAPCCRRSCRSPSNSSICRATIS